MNKTRFFAFVAVLVLSSGAQAVAPLRLWHAYRGGEEAALESAVKLFEREGGRKVELLALPYDAFASKLIAAIPHGVGPDVFIYAHERVRQFARMGIVGAVDGVIDRAAYFPNTLDALEVDGKLYGYPMSLKCVALYVNAQLVPKPRPRLMNCAPCLRA